MTRQFKIEGDSLRVQEFNDDGEIVSSWGMDFPTAWRQRDMWPDMPSDMLAQVQAIIEARASA